jgi:predicted 2-oxoglutarate/Fe(II)-dependent dioxygenase YbiX
VLIFVAYRYTEGQRFGRHIDESVDLGDGSKTYYTLLIYLSGRGSAKDSSGQALVGGETVFYDQRGGIVAEVLSGSKILISLIRSHQVCLIVSSKEIRSWRTAAAVKEMKFIMSLVCHTCYWICTRCYPV